MVYVVIRILLALYTFASLVAVTVTAEGSYHSVMAYLTIWTYLMLTLHFWVAAAVAAFLFLTKKVSQQNDTLQGQSVNLGYVSENRTCNSTEPNIQNGNINRVGENNTLGDVIHNGKGETFNQNGTVKYSRADIGSSGAINSTVNLDTYRNVDITYRDTTWYMKLSWFLGNIVQNFAIIVTIVYFTVLFPAMLPTVGINWNDFNMHAINTILILFDIMISARPVRLLHFVYPILYGLAYIIFSTIYWSQDPAHNVLYPILDYSKAGLASAVILGLGFVVIPLFQLLNFGIYKLRLHIYFVVYDELYQ